MKVRPSSMLACCLVVMSSSCTLKTREDVIAESGDARLVRVKGVGGGVAVGAPHAPIAIPYVKRVEGLQLLIGKQAISFSEGELTIPEGSKVTLDVDPDGKRFAVTISGSPPTLFHLLRPETGVAVADPQPLPAGPVQWAATPRLENRLPALFGSLKYPGYAIDEAELRGGKAAVADLLADTAATAPNAETEWAFTFDNLDPSLKPRVQDALRRHLKASNPTDATIRRSLKALGGSEPALSSAQLAPLLARESLQEAERAALLVLARANPGVDALACQLLGKVQQGDLASAALMALSGSPLDCPAAGAVLLAKRCDIIQFTAEDCDVKRARAEMDQHLAQAPKSLVHAWPTTAVAAFWHACLRGPLPEVVRTGLLRRSYDTQGVRALWGESVASDAACDAPPGARKHTYQGHAFGIDDAKRRLFTIP